MGGRLTFSSLVLGTSLGTGLSRGIGAPDVRWLAMIALPGPVEEPSKPASVEAPLDDDADRDGIRGAADSSVPTRPKTETASTTKTAAQNKTTTKTASSTQDKCPDKAEDRDGFEDQDGCPEQDNDRDGILDKQDKCPDKAEDLDHWLDDDGCPEEDNDQDGILDAQDKCPNEAETKNGVDDEDGCPDFCASRTVKSARSSQSISTTPRRRFSLAATRC